MEPRVAEHLRAVAPGLRRRLLATVREAMRAQGRSLTGGQGRGLTLGVETAVEAFVEQVAGPARDLDPTRAVFHRLGRTEYAEGHRVDALRAVLTVGGRDVWAYLVEHPGPLSPDDLYALAGALFGFIDTLAGAAAEGYLDEQRDAARDWATVRRRLVTLLVQPDPPGDPALQAAADAARWPLPGTVAVLSAEGTDAEHLGRALGGAAVATVIGDAVRAVVPDPHPAAVARALAGRRAAVGPAVPLRRARLSYRLSARALALQAEGALPGGVLHCADHLLDLLAGWEPGLAGLLADAALAPLAGLRPGPRRTLEQTLLAWLRADGQVVPAAEALGAHPQTVRYRLRRLRELFGAALDDPDARLALHLALRGLNR
ncbi:helix-turn-helix domain-containing protein [Spirilliplanes yamanashiensis]|uniref:Fis family transcriptional regulator n=1 Tax=Spirilliplanes yamanashiensis TaxID=42233 RepID=A0A8J3Y7Q0_9ACTN|nr:helix-turn-helix domain-containing protein [Spirilliplanes yamanashiensis]MDP9817458.1 hypothetical protein [Spirilliplanes yamanashiensis]GIJ02889.1 Fis family transcriptional regulator [Spirilliplanes yamanashiensis]